VQEQGGRVRAAAWAAVGVGVASGAARLLVEVAASGLRTADSARPDELVLVGLAWLGAALALWLAVGSGLALLALLPGAAGRLAAGVAERVTPLAVRKVLTVLLGASVGSLALPPASLSSAGSAPVAAPARGGEPGGLGAAGTRGASRGGGGPDAAPAVPGPGFLPSMPGDAVGRDRPEHRSLAAPVGPGYRPSADHGAPAPSPASSPAPSPGFRPSEPLRVADDEQNRLLTPSPRPSTVAHGLVTVRRGDSLWTIARRHLGPDASDADVARAWPRWYATNRAVIGEDPDRIVPGLQLAPPASGAAGDATTSHPVPKE
jgi:nucleoid-associated protein YgaU